MVIMIQLKKVLVDTLQQTAAAAAAAALTAVAKIVTVTPLKPPTNTMNIKDQSTNNISS